MRQIWIKYLPDFIYSRVKSRYQLQKIIDSIGWLVVDKAVGIVFGLGVGILVARYLGPEQLGYLSYSMAFVGLFAPLAKLGLASVTVRELVHEPSSDYEILGTAFGVQFAGSLVAMMSIGVANLYFNWDNRLIQFFVLIISFGLIFQSFNIIDYWFQSNTEVKYVVLVQRSTFIVTAVIKMLLIILQAPLSTFVGVVALESFLMAGGFYVVYCKFGGKLKKWKFRLRRARVLFFDSLPLLFSGIAVVIYLRIDVVMLGQMANQEVVGVYSAAVRISELWYFVPTAIALAVFPAIIRAQKDQNKYKYRQKMQLFYDGMAGLSYLIIIPVWLTSSLLVKLLYGEQYFGAGQILAIHIWSLIFVSLGVARGKWLVAGNFGSLYFTTTGLGALVNVALNYLLIPQFAGIGAAWATVIAYLTSAYLSCLLYRITWPVFIQMSKSLFIPFRLFYLKGLLREFYELADLETVK